MQTTTELLNTIPQTGRVEWIGIANERVVPLQSVESVEVTLETGIVGEHHATRKPQGKRQVTLIQAEHLPVIAALAGHETITPDQLRRNIVVSGINLLALKGQRFQIGEVELEGTGPCDPCSRMEAELGPGGFNAMRGHGGLTARVHQPGRIHVSDPVSLI